MIRLFFLITLFITALCETSFSQSAFSLDDLETARLFTSRDYVHGIGAVKAYADEKNERCLETSIQSLDSNQFISVFVEIFNEGGRKFFEFPEFAIRQDSSVFQDSLIIRDSLQIDQDFYCFTTALNEQNQSLTPPALPDLAERPIKVGEYWFSAGAQKNRLSVPVRNFMKSKNEALKKLAQTYSTSVRQELLDLNGQTASFAYMKTAIIFQDVIVVQRYVSQDFVYSIIAVRESDMSNFTQ